VRCADDDLVGVVFGGLAPLVIEKVEDAGDRVVVRARTPLVAVACPDCGVATARVHGRHERTVGDVPIDARRVQVLVLVRRLVCPTFGCRQTFREQVPGVLERYQRRVGGAWYGVRRSLVFPVVPMMRKLTISNHAPMEGMVVPIMALWPVANAIETNRPRRWSNGMMNSENSWIEND
jgi:transposase